RCARASRNVGRHLRCAGTCRRGLSRVALRPKERAALGDKSFAEVCDDAESDEGVRSWPVAGGLDFGGASPSRSDEAAEWTLHQLDVAPDRATRCACTRPR